MNFLDLEGLRASAYQPRTNLRLPATDSAVGETAWLTLLLAQSLTHAQENVKFYRQRADTGQSPRAADFTCIQDLEQYPFITRHDLSAHTSDFLSRGNLPDRIESTSGTSGRSLLIYSNADEREAQYLLSRIL